MGSGRERVALLALCVAFSLHFMSSSLQSSGDGTYTSLFFTKQSEGDTKVIATLVERRQHLHREIGELQATVASMQNAIMQRKTMSPEPLRRNSMGTVPVLPAVPPAVPAVPPPASPFVPPVVQAPPAVPPVPVAPVAPVEVAPRPPAVVPLPAQPIQVAPPPPPQPVTPAIPATPATMGKAMLFSDDAVPPNFVDFPCPLRDLKKAQVTTTCELACRDSTCGRATDVCAGYVECDAVVVKAPRGADLALTTAVLKHDSTKAKDNSLERLYQSSWWNSVAMTTEAKPRIYIVASYGGCVSKMMAGWLSQLPSKFKQHVYHIHDPNPPPFLNQHPKPPAPSMKQDYRTGRFPGGSKFKKDNPRVPDNDMDRYRVVYIYKDPVEALVSRYGHGHCTHIQGDCGASEAQWPKLDGYSKQGKDRMRLIEHFNAFVHPSVKRNYPVVAVNYHRLWDNLPAVMAAFGLPPEMAGKFPPRTETVRNDLTGKAEGNAAHTEETRAGLKRMYSVLIEEVKQNPAVLVI